MDIYLYRCADDNHTIPKHLDDELKISGYLRNATDFANPVIQFEMGLSDIYNYAYIPDFGRYYYLSPPVSVRNGLIEYTGRIDVLQSWYKDFMYSPMIAGRSDSTYNKYLPDTSRKLEQQTQNQYVRLGSFDPIYSAIIVTAG